MIAPRPRRFLCLGFLLLVALPASVWAWAGAQHIQINRAAGRNVPDEMAAFRSFSRPMVIPSIYPDLWKGGDASEGPRHYFEPDRLPPNTDIRELSPIQSTAFSSMGMRPDEIGIAPWTILDLLGKMTEAMRTNDWLWAARYGATLSHYVADVHMPLHCTKNFNGQETWQHGVHSRFESDMTKAFFRPDQIDPAPSVYIEDPFRAVMEWTAHSASLVPDVLKADIIAKRSAGGRVDTEGYYLKLWALTKDTVNSQIAESITHLSSLWYTAWVNAGKPAIPEPFEELPTYSVHSGVGLDPLTDGDPMGTTLHQKKTYDAIIWAVMGFLAILVIGSSLYRSAQARRAKGQ